MEDIIREHGAFVRRALAQMGVPARDLDDVEQEVWRGVARGLPAFDPTLAANPETALRGWLFGICERQARSHRRTENKRGEVFGEVDVASDATPEDALLAAERTRLLQTLLARLSPEKRAVVVAYELEGVPMADVAAAQGIPVNTAWNRLRLGREELRAAARRGR